ncbi:hypothetical protein B0H63DRAFT_448213 [Podospora didyma]|uniref:Uncharacterized protein n=1 Tax=Podospora didyma TaxID=330526 RepID=A0AAE0NTJ7_9PEZI|nr:hypothetical protein B0H63DRAFT_448213 [Podospora didyma]
MFFAKLAALALLVAAALMATAAPSANEETLTHLHGTSVEQYKQVKASWEASNVSHHGLKTPTTTIHESQSASDCSGSFPDPFGNVDCSQLSIVFGDHVTPNDRDIMSVFTKDGKVLFPPSVLGCVVDDIPGDYWNNFTVEGLPHSLDIHPGNLCLRLKYSDHWWDNAWVHYGNQFLNVPTDDRCKGIWPDEHNQDMGQRCLIDVSG